MAPGVMAASDSPAGSPARPRGKNDSVSTTPARKRSQSDSSGLFAGIVFVLVLIVLASLITGCAVIMVLPTLSQHASVIELDMPSLIFGPAVTPVPTPVVPAILMSPADPPDMMDHARLKLTDDIVGVWQCTNPQNYNLTVYDDNTYVIYDKYRDKYTIGTWKKDSPYLYMITEPGRDDTSRILGDANHLQFQYDYGDGRSRIPELADYTRVFYPGFSTDMFQK